jgi:hypothetical protein
MLHRRPRFRTLGGLATYDPPAPLGPPAFAVGEVVTFQSEWMRVDAIVGAREHVYLLKNRNAPSPTTRMHAREHELTRPRALHRRGKQA